MATGTFGPVHAERRPTDRAVSRLLRRREVSGSRPSRGEAMGGRLADRAGGRERREGPRPRAPTGGRQGLPFDALAEGRTGPRAGGLLQDLDRPEGRQEDQGIPVATSPRSAVVLRGPHVLDE